MALHKTILNRVITELAAGIVAARGRAGARLMLLLLLMTMMLIRRRASGRFSRDIV